jgi:hypothetical protein
MTEVRKIYTPGDVFLRGTLSAANFTVAMHPEGIQSAVFQFAPDFATDVFVEAATIRGAHISVAAGIVATSNKRGWRDGDRGQWW